MDKHIKGQSATKNLKARIIMTRDDKKQSVVENVDRNCTIVTEILNE